MDSQTNVINLRCTLVRIPQCSFSKLLYSTYPFNHRLKVISYILTVSCYLIMICVLKNTYPVLPIGLYMHVDCPKVRWWNQNWQQNGQNLLEILTAIFSKEKNSQIHLNYTVKSQQFKYGQICIDDSDYYTSVIVLPKSFWWMRKGIFLIHRHCLAVLIEVPDRLLSITFAYLFDFHSLSAVNL